MCVRRVARLTCAAKHRNKDLWYYGQMVTMPYFGLDGVNSRLAEFMSTFQLLFVYYLRNPGTTDKRQHTSGAGSVLQPAGYNSTRLPPASRAGRKTTRARQFVRVAS